MTHTPTRLAAALTAAGAFLLVAPATADPGVGPAHAGTPTRAVPRAGGAVTLGQTGDGSAHCFSTAPFGSVLDVEAPGSPTYIAPFSGVVTSYQTFTNDVAGSARLLVLRDGADANHKILSAKSAASPVVTSALNTFPVRVPMKAGERLGLNLGTSGMACGDAGFTGDATRIVAGFDPDVTSDLAYSLAPSTTFRPSVSAVLEPDADGDGYGGVSQDLCPQSSVSQAACAVPETTVTKAPKKRSTKRKPTIVFTSSVAGATFTCAVDKKKAKPCTSPLRKKYAYGKHTVTITATVAGVADPTPAVVRFRVTRPS